MFVNDGSTDATGRILDEFAAGYDERVQIVHLDHNLGKAEAVRQGVLRSVQDNPSFFGYWDADLATPLNAVQTLLEVILEDDEVDIVMGARVGLLGRHIRRRPIRHYLGRVFATCASVVLGIAVYDTQCGAKILRNNVRTRRIFQEPFLSTWIFDVELLARYLAHTDPSRDSRFVEHGVYEVPLKQWIDKGDSKTHPRDFIRAAWELVRVWARYERRDGLG